MRQSTYLWWHGDQGNEGSPRSGFEEPISSPTSKTFKLSSMTLIKSHTWSSLERIETIHISLTRLLWGSRNSALVKAFMNYKVPCGHSYSKIDFLAMNQRVVITWPFKFIGQYFALTISAGSTRQGPCPQKLRVQLRRQNLQACPQLPSWIHEKANKIYC